MKKYAYATRVQTVSTVLINKFMVWSTVIILMMISSLQAVAQHSTSTGEITKEGVTFYYLYDIPRTEKSFNRMREWTKEYFTPSPFLSSIKTNPDENAVDVKSKVLLLLPMDGQDKREEVLMHYRFQACMVGYECAIKYTIISFSFPKGFEKERITTRISAQEVFQHTPKSKDSEKVSHSFGALIKGAHYFMEQETNSSLLEALRTHK